MLSRLRFILLTLILLSWQVVFAAPPAMAWTSTASGEATCNTATGEYDVSWTVNNPEDEDMTIQHSNRPAVSGVVKKNKSKDFNETLPGDTSGTTTLSLQVNWPSDQALHNVSASVTTDGKCTAESPQQVTICHRTDSVTNPYVKETVAAASVDGDSGNDNGQGDHLLEHTGAVFNPNTSYPTPHNGDQWGDIIPPFDVDGNSYDGPPQTSLNWTTDGQAIWNNNCNVPETGSITIEKNAVPDSSQTFHFTTTNLSTDATGFDLTDDSTSGLPQKIFNNLAGGTYTVTEGATTGWDFDGISCSDQSGNSTIAKSGRQVSITLAAGDKVTCAYTNHERGTITVHKVTDPAGDPTDFTVTASGTPTTSGATAINGSATQTDLSTSHDVVYDVAQGTYSVTEQSMVGWLENDDDCTNLTVNSSHLNIECTIYNTKKAKLNIVKATNPDGSSQSFSFSVTGPSITQANNSFVLDTNGSDDTYSDHNQYTDLTPGTYTITETEPSNWTLSGLSCTGISYTWDGKTQTLSLDVPAGADITCTFTNTEYASISGYKYEVNSDGTHVDVLGGWTITLKDSGGNVVNTKVTGNDGSYIFAGLLTGSYTIWETLQNGWTQIFAPSNPVSLTAGQSSGNNDFGNFKNASISGYKFNDLNGQDGWDAGEPIIGGWTISLTGTTSMGTPVSESTTTDLSTGKYVFSDLAPGEYTVCEENPANSGYAQTFPAGNNGCYDVTVAQSGHEYTDNNFGNQGRATITVIKNVDDGFGNITKNVDTWTWGYDGVSFDDHIQTGSTNPQELAAGNYNIWENSQGNYHFTSVSCSNDTGSVSVDNSSSFDVTLDPGENLICTFLNTRDTGTITVHKILYPSTDNGLFNLQINGSTYATDVGDGGQTQAVKVVTGDGYYVSETAGTNTSLDSYQSEYFCDNDLTSGGGTTSTTFSVNQDQNINCYFENVRLGTITGVKFNDYNKSGNRDSGEPTLSGWTIRLYSMDLQLGTESLVNTAVTDGSGTYSFNNLAGGTYKVCEVQQDGWIQTAPGTSDGCSVVAINLSTDTESGGPGQIVTVDFGNVKKVKPVVLSIHTKELVNTGANALATIFVGLAMLGLLGAVTRATKHQQ